MTSRLPVKVMVGVQTCAGAGLVLGWWWCCAAPASFIQPAPATASMAATTGSRVTP